MKQRIASLCLFLVVGSLSSQNWTWVKGPTMSAVTGSYGTMGTAASSNNPGGRHGCATWTDILGNLWLFGGEGYSTNNTLCWLSDLWKYDPFTNQWTWIRGSSGINTPGVYGTLGVASSSNDPGAREFSVTWTDAQGNFWMFGGDGFGVTAGGPAQKLNDLWKYNPSSNQWTWMGGPNTTGNNGIYGTQGVTTTGNIPGGRAGAAAWIDNNGKMWLYGGHGLPASGVQSGALNDLWRYDPSNNTWTWMTGTNLINQPGIYGTLGAPSGTYTPGGRQWTTYWKSPTGDFYLFGGRGLASGTLSGWNNDMWKYSVSANTWAWVSGSNAISQHGVYGTQGVPSTTNVPGARHGSAGWIDGMGDLWLFGGYGFPNVIYTAATAPGYLSDLFRYKPSTAEWTWFKGSDTLNRNGIYGSLGVAAPSNNPGARSFNDYWKGGFANTFWLFGGEGFDQSSNDEDHMNDLWKFNPPCSPDSITAAPAYTVCSGTPVILTAYNQFSSTVAWYLTGISGSPIASGTNYTTAPLTALSSNSVYAFYAEANSCTATPRAAVTITAIPLPSLQISGATTICEKTPFTLTVTGASTYTWNTASNASVITVTASPPSVTYFVLGRLNGCESSTSTTVTVMSAPVVSLTTSAPTICIGSSAMLTALGNDSYAWNTTLTGNTIVVSPSVTTTYTVIATGTNSCKTSASITQNVSPCINVSELAPAELHLFPNPSHGMLFLSRVPLQGARIVIYDLLGSRVLESDLSGSSLRTDLPRGVYLYTIAEPGHQIITGKIIIE
jgi:N-acetylneuraminic acid mutarotase